MSGYGRAPLEPSRQKARQRAGEPNPMNEGQRRWRERVGITELEDRVAEAQAWLRERDGQVAALVERVEYALPHESISAANAAPEHSSTCLRCRVLDDLPAASKAILAAAEREPGLRAALKRIESLPVNQSLTRRIEVEAHNIARAALADGS